MESSWFDHFRSPNNVVERILVYQAIGTLFGSWVGIIPIALDWDRPWQVRGAPFLSVFRQRFKGMASNPRFWRYWRLYCILPRGTYLKLHDADLARSNDGRVNKTQN